ncbi:MAG: DMT family transporter [Coleofasciculaceae cyanobacterium]
MTQLDQPEDSRANNLEAAEVLRAMTQDIQNLRQNLLAQLSQDIERLQREKTYLRDDIDKLKSQRQQQIFQQQELVQQIAPDLANQLQKVIRSKLSQGGRRSRHRRANSQYPVTANDYNESANRVIADLDYTLRTTFKTLQQDVSSYQSALSQQLGEMHSLEEQGEAILEALVSKLRKELESEISINKPTQFAPVETALYEDREAEKQVSAIPEPVETVAEQKTKSAAKSQKAGKVVWGFLLVLASSLLLAFQNIVIPILFNKSSLFGLVELGGLVVPSLGNSLLILWLRMLIVVPSLAGLITVLYPEVWRDTKQFLQSKDLPLFINVISGGFFLFLSQVLVYLALGTIAPGVAIAIFFVYPILTMILTWLMLGVRPTRFSNLLMFSVLVGFILLTIVEGSVKLSGVGVTAAVGSAIAFALYVLLAQTSGRKVHPMPLIQLNFVLVLVFSSIALVAPLPEAWQPNVIPSLYPGLLLGSLILGGTTILSFLCNNIGIKMIDAARASVLGAIVPSLTALLALVVIQSTMQAEQIFGMLLVTLGIAALSIDRLRRQRKMTQATNNSR